MDSGIPKELEAEIASDQITERMLRQAISRLSSHWKEKPNVLADATMVLLVRIANSWSTVNTLARTAPDRSLQDIGAIFRIMFEAFLQLKYILVAPDEQVARARLFVEYQDVEMLKQQERIFKHDTGYSRLLAKSPRREQGEQQLRARFSRIAKNYLRSKKRKPPAEIAPSHTRDHWYDGTLRNMAIEIGAEAEFDLWVGLFHGYIHSSYLGCRFDSPMISNEDAPYWASQIAAHSAKAVLDLAEVKLADDLQAWVDVFTEKPLGTMPPEIEASIQNERKIDHTQD